MSGVSNANIRDYVNFEFPCICSFYRFIATNVGVITKIRVETTDFTKKTRIRKRWALAEGAEARREEWWGRTAGVPDFFSGEHTRPRVWGLATRRPLFAVAKPARLRFVQRDQVECVVQGWQP